jgi:integrase
MTLRSVSACLGWANRNDMIPSNVAKKVPKPKSRSRSADAIIPEADHTKLMEAATPDFRIVLKVLHGTGCRPGEACRITTEAFHPESGCVVLTEHKADRTGTPRVVFLPPALVDILKAQAERFGKGQLLRSRKGVPWTGRSITQAMRRLKKKVGVKAIAYGYRHTYATDALAGGVPDAQVAAILGHTSTAMLHKHYSHLTSRADVLRQAAAKVRGDAKT